MKNFTQLKQLLLAGVFAAGGTVVAEGSVVISSANFPDPAMLSFAQSYDDGDGVLSDEEISSAYSVDLSDRGIVSCQGIAFFTEIRYFYLANNDAITSIDLTGLKLLEEVYIKNNAKLTTVTLSSSSEMVSYLDVSGNPKLTNISFPDKNSVRTLVIGSSPIPAFSFEGFYNLERLDLSGNTTWGTTLDVSRLGALQTIEVDDAPFETLIAHDTPNLGYFYKWPFKHADFSGTAFSEPTESIQGYLSWDSESNQYVYGDCALETLDLSDISGSTYITVSGFKNLKSLKLSSSFTCDYCRVMYNPALTSVDFSGSDGAWEVNLSENPSLTTITWGDKYATQELTLDGCSSLQAFDLSGFTSLQSLYMRNLTSWGTTLDVSGLENLATFDVSGSPLETLIAHKTPQLSYNYTWPFKHVDFSNKGYYESLLSVFSSVTYNDETYEYDPCALETLDLSNNPEISDISVSYFPNLKTLKIGDNSGMSSLTVSYNKELTSIDMKNSPELRTFILEHNDALETIDCNLMPAVEYVNLTENLSLKPFDLSVFPNLISLGFRKNTGWGKTLDVSGLTYLNSIDMNDSGIEELVAHQTPTLYYDRTWPVKRLDFSDKGFSAATNLYLQSASNYDPETDSYEPLDCALESVDLSKNPYLAIAYISDFSSLKSVNLSDNQTLAEARFINNPSLVSVDLQKNPLLSSVTASDGTVPESITWGDKTTLRSLCFSRSGVKAFPLSDFTSLEEIWIDDNTAWGNTLDISGLHPKRLYIRDSSVETIVAREGAYWSLDYCDGVEQVKHLDISYDPSSASPSTLYLMTGLESVDMSNSPNLKTFSIAAPNLRSFTLDNCPKLIGLNLSYTRVPDFDIAARFPDLEELSIDHYWTNEPAERDGWWEHLDVSQLKKLRSLSILNNKIPFLNLGENDNMTYQYGLWEQFPDFTLTQLSANEVGVAMDNGFNVEKIVTLTVDGSPVEPSATTVDGQLYFVLYRNAATANDLVSKDIYYEYQTNYKPNGAAGELLKVNAKCVNVQKCPSFLKLSDTSVTGTLPLSTLDAPAITRSEGYDGKLTYTSSNPSVATCADGKLTIVGAGETTISVSGEETAYRQAPQAVSFTVTISKASPMLTFADYQVNALMNDPAPQNPVIKGIYDGPITYKSSNPNVATVSATGGELTIVGAGETTITASGIETAICNQPGAGSYKLTVKKRANGLSIAATEVTGTYGEAAPAAPLVTPVQGYDGTFTYKSSNTKVVTVAANGKLTIVGAGEATVTVTAPETNAYYAADSKTYKVKIEKAWPNFFFDLPSVALDNPGNDTRNYNQLNIGVYDGTVVYSTNDPSIATVDALGQVTFLKAGAVTIIANGAETANCHASSATYEIRADIVVGINGMAKTPNDGHYYTPAGVLVLKPVKGRLYIRNGKKVVYGK